MKPNTLSKTTWSFAAAALLAATSVTGATLHHLGKRRPVSI